MNTCRFCKKWSPEYGVRHYAHYECYLDAGKDLFMLPRREVARFPYKLLKARGLLDKIERMERVGNG